METQSATYFDQQVIQEMGKHLQAPAWSVKQKLALASIMGSATLCFSRWTQRRGRQLHRFQNRHKHGAWLLTEKALRCRRPVRPGEEKVVNGSAARPLARPIEPSQLMAA